MMNIPPKRSTMRQVAKAAGVSAMTVSKVLGNKPGVSEEARKRVREAAALLNYTPNLLAKSFRTDRTDTVGVLLSSSLDAVFAPLFGGIGTAATELGFGTLLAGAADDPQSGRKAARMLAAHRVDGMILASPLPLPGELRSYLDNLGLPYVLVGQDSDDPEATTVSADEYGGAYSAAAHLADAGCRRFLLLALESELRAALPRLQGWRDALRDHGRAPAADDVDHVPATIQGGCDAIRARLRKGFLWDAVLCGDDLVALGAMDALLEEGLDIPDEVRIVGHGDIPLAGHFRVPLTTVRRPLEEMGARAMRLLAQRIGDHAAAPRQVVMKGELVVRISG